MKIKRSILTDDSFQAYIKCPMQYKLRFIDKREPHKQPINLLYTETLKSIFSFFYFNLMESHTASLKFLLSKWSSQWFSPKNIRVYGSNLLEEFSNQGVFLIQKFYHWVKVNPGTPVAVNLKYSHVFVREKGNVEFFGTLDLIKIMSDRSPHREKQLIRYDNSLYKPTDFEVSRDLLLSLYSLMFRTLFNRREKAVYILHTSTASLFSTTRNKAEREYVQKVIFRVADAIENKLFYPRVEHGICKYCLWKSYCRSEAYQTREEKK